MGQKRAAIDSVCVFVLNKKFGGGIHPGNTIVIASSVSNGGGASVRAAEKDERNLIDGVAVSEPNVNPEPGAQFGIVQGCCKGAWESPPCPGAGVANAQHGRPKSRRQKFFAPRSETYSIGPGFASIPMKPLRFGIFTLGRVFAFISSRSPMMLLTNRR